MSLERQLSTLEVGEHNLERNRVIRQLIRSASRRIWWFRQFKKIGFRTPPLNLLSSLRPVFALNPTNESLLKAGKGLLECLNEKSKVELKKWTRANENHPLIIVIGCKKRRKKLASTLRIIRKSQGNGNVIGVVGNNKMPDWSYRFNASTGILQIPCRDSYEGLPEKIIWTCLAVHLSTNKSIFKIDDDTREIQTEQLLRLTNVLKAKNKQAAGSQISVESPLQIDRGWHLGRCSGTANKKPFVGISPKKWMSGGAGYLVTSKGVKTLAAFCMHSWDFVQSQIYEDVTVSWILQSKGRQIYWIKHWQELGAINERTCELSSGRQFCKPYARRGRK